MKKINLTCVMALLFASLIPQQILTIEPVSNQSEVAPAKEELKNLQSEKTKQELQEEPQISAEEKEILDKMLHHSLEQLQEIYNTLQELSLTVENNIVKPKNKHAVIHEIKTLMNLIDQVIKKSNSADTGNPTDINFILALSNELMRHVGYFVKKGLNKMPKFNIESVITRMVDPTLEALFYKYAENNQMLFQFKKASSNVGLSWFNKLYRKAASVYAKGSKRSLWSRIAKGTLIGAASLYAMYRIAPFTNKLSWVTKLLGEPPRTNGFGELKNINKLGKLGKTESILYQYTQGLMPAAALFAMTIPTVIKGEWEKLTEKASRYGAYIHNKCLGGLGAKIAREEYDDTIPRFTFKDVVGSDYIKNELEDLIEYIMKYYRYQNLGISTDKGYLFTGVPGTGKSFMAEALAGEIRGRLKEINDKDIPFKFLKIELEDIKQHGIDYILVILQEHAPCVLFIDEIDLLGLQRNEDRDLLNKFLNGMSGYLKDNIKAPVIVLGATNRDENLDAALKRPGRFGKQLLFELPSLEDRKNYLTKRLKPIVANLKDYDVDKLAMETEGCTYESLNKIICAAFLKTRRKGIRFTQKHLENALNTEVRQIIDKGHAELTERENKIVASHQAASALTNILLESSKKLACITLKPVRLATKEQTTFDNIWSEEQKKIQHGQMFTYTDDKNLTIDPKENKLRICKAKLAGSIGEEIIHGSTDYSYNNQSRQEAIEYLMQQLSKGSNKDKLPKKLKEKYVAEAIEMADKLEDEVRELLNNNKKHLQAIYKALIDNKTLYAQQVKNIIKNGHVK